MTIVGSRQTHDFGMACGYYEHKINFKRVQAVNISSNYAKATIITWFGNHPIEYLLHFQVSSFDAPLKFLLEF